MCWPRLEGGIEIEERYPRTLDPREPRRKRLNFVRDREGSNRRSSDDYTLMRSPFNNARPIRREMQEIHDPRQLQQQEHQFRMIQGHNQQLQGQLRWTDDQRRRLEFEQAQQHQHPPPPPLHIANHPHEQRHIQHPHHGHAGGAEVVDEFHPQPHPNLIEIAPRPQSHLPHHVRHQSHSRGRSQRRNHSGASVYSADHDHHRRMQRSPTVYGSSADSFDDLLSPRRYY
ncbi:MAG: hypothetical protein Q9202_004199 [Teloschistes flavicans]